MKKCFSIALGILFFFAMGVLMIGYIPRSVYEIGWRTDAEGNPMPEISHFQRPNGERTRPPLRVTAATEMNASDAQVEEMRKDWEGVGRTLRISGRLDKVLVMLKQPTVVARRFAYIGEIRCEDVPASGHIATDASFDSANYAGRGNRNGRFQGTEGWKSFVQPIELGDSPLGGGGLTRIKQAGLDVQLSGGAVFVRNLKLVEYPFWWGNAVDGLSSEWKMGLEGFGFGVLVALTVTWLVNSLRKRRQARELRRMAEIDKLKL